MLNLQVQREALDRKAVAWLVDCIMADARDEQVSRLSDYLTGCHPKNLTMTQLLKLNPATALMSAHLCKQVNHEM